MTNVMTAPMKRATTSGPARWRNDPPASSRISGGTSEISVQRLRPVEQGNGRGLRTLRPVADHHVPPSQTAEHVVELASGQTGRVAAVEADAEVLPEHLALERVRVAA